jgi:hypothetical protein
MSIQKGCGKKVATVKAEWIGSGEIMAVAVDRRVEEEIAVVAEAVDTIQLESWITSFHMESRCRLTTLPVRRLPVGPIRGADHTVPNDDAEGDEIRRIAP